MGGAEAKPISNFLEQQLISIWDFFAFFDVEKCVFA
jgi:hypothetical protein